MGKIGNPTEFHNVGLLLTTSEEDETNDPYFMSIRVGVERVCEQYGLNTASVITVGKSDLSLKIVGSLDGLIVIGDGL